MALVVMTFLACVAGTTDCRRVELVKATHMAECVTQAQAIIATWLAEHPGHVVVGRHTCAIGREA